MTRQGWIASAVVAAVVGAAAGSHHAFAAARDAQGADRVFELRTYTANPGKFEAMQARFRDHILPLFKKHHLTVIGFWTYADPPASENTLVYILAHESREAAKTNWAAFSKDPVRLKVWEETEKDGPINQKVVSVFLDPVSFSPIK
jgi:hypothetical protein